MGSQSLYPRIGHLPSASVDFSAGGDNTLVALTANKRIAVHRIWLVVSTATNLTFKSGSTALTGAIAMSANGGLTFDATGEPWFVTALGEAFILNQSGTAQVSGRIYYSVAA